MKIGKSVTKAFKNLVIKTNQNQGLSLSKKLGVTIIPIGVDDLFVALPSLKDTYTYNIINTDEMSGNITLKTSDGASFKGLVLNNSNGLLSIDPIQFGTDEFILENNIKDGSFIQTLSNGYSWFIWSVATGGTISTGNNGQISRPYIPTIQQPTYADVLITSFTSNTDFPSLTAEHDLFFVGTAEPNSTLEIVEASGLVATQTTQVDSNGDWSWDILNISNGSYTFTFTSKINNLPVGQSASQIFADNTGPLRFTTPLSFSPDPAEIIDFASLASAQDPYGNPIALTIDSSSWNANLNHGDTFQVIYSFSYNGIDYEETVEGTIVDDTPPAAPVINSASIVNVNELIADGTSEPNKTITLFQGNTVIGTTTSDGAGFWSISGIIIAFNSNFNLKAQASEIGSGLNGINRSAFSNEIPINLVQPQTPTPTLTIAGETSGVWTNISNNITLTGTTVVGAGIALTMQGATLISGPTVDPAGNWTADISVLDESVTQIFAQATLPNNNPSQQANFQLNVDRVNPVITVTGGAQTVYLGDIGTSNDQGATATDFSPVTVVSDWATAVDATEGTKTVTYTATDAAGNTAIASRTVTVTTEVIVPTNLVAVDNGDGTVTLTGDVVGTYADNLDVKINVIDSAGLEAVYQVSSSDVSFAVTGGSFTAIMILDADTYTFEAQTINLIGEASLFDDCTASNSVQVVEPEPAGEFYEDRLHSTTIGDYTNPTNVLTQATYDDSTGVLTVNSYSAPEAILNVNGGTTAFATNNDPANDGDLTKKVSISMWLKTSAGFTGTRTYMQVFRVDNANTPNYPLFQIIMRNGNFVTNSPYTQGTFDLANNFTVENGFNNLTFQLLDDQWHHFMYYYDGASNGSQKIFIDGVLAASKTHNSDRGIISQYMHSGFSKFFFNQSGQDFIGGDFDSLTFYQGFEMTEQIAAWIAADSTRQRIYVEGTDVAAPTITITNNADSSDITNATVNIIEGDAFAFTVTATDDIDGNISGNVVTGGDTLDTNTAGTYNLTFNVSDSAGNPATQVTLTVEVEAYVISSAGLENRAGVTLNNASIDGDGALVIAAASNSYASLPMTSEFRSSTNQTMSLWFKSSTTPAGGYWSRLIASHVVGSGTNGFFLELRSSTKIYFKGATENLLSDLNPTATASYSLTDGNWHHIILSWSAVPSEQIRVWVDGQPITVNNQNHVGAGTDSKTTLFIGNGNSGFSNPMEIDAVYITEEFIDDAEALSRYNRQARVQP